MKKIFFLFFSLITLNCFSQTGTWNNIQVYNNMVLNGKKVNNISNDSSLVNQSQTALPTEWAVYNYFLNHKYKYYLPYNGNSSYYLGGDTLFHFLPSYSAGNAITFSGVRIDWGGQLNQNTIVDATFNKYDVSFINSGNVSILSDTATFQTKYYLNMEVDAFYSDSTLIYGAKTQWSNDTLSTPGKYSDALNSYDAPGGNNLVYINRFPGTPLVIETRYSFDSIPLTTTTNGFSAKTSRYLKIYQVGGKNLTAFPPDSIWLEDNYLQTKTLLDKGKTVNYYSYTQTGTNGDYGNRFTILFSKSQSWYKGRSKIIANPDSTGSTPTNMAYFDKDTLKVGQPTNKIIVKSTDPTVADIPDGFSAIYQNSTSGLIYLWANKNGVLFKVQLQ